MRLIDADALLQRAVAHGWSTPKWVSNIVIEDAPTIEAEPIKHGRWKVNNETEEWVTIYCDQCHDGMWNRKGDPYPNYCFNCGARMDLTE